MPPIAMKIKLMIVIERGRLCMASEYEPNDKIYGTGATALNKPLMRFAALALVQN